MGKYDIEAPDKHRARSKRDKTPPEPPKMIEVVEVPTELLCDYVALPMMDLRHKFTARTVQYFKLSELPPAGHSWLRDDNGRTVIYRQN